MNCKGLINIISLSERLMWWKLMNYIFCLMVFLFIKMCKRWNWYQKKKVTKIVYLLFKLYTPTFNISHFIEAGIFNERFRKRKEKTAHTILFRMYMPLCIPLFRLCELFKSRKGITKNIRCWINVFDRPS